MLAGKPVKILAAYIDLCFVQVSTLSQQFGLAWPKRAGYKEIEGERERCFDVRWGSICGLVWRVDQSFAVRKDGELNILCDRGRRCTVLSWGCSHKSTTTFSFNVNFAQYLMKDLTKVYILCSVNVVTVATRYMASDQCVQLLHQDIVLVGDLQARHTILEEERPWLSLCTC